MDDLADATDQRLLRDRHHHYWRDHPPPHFHAAYGGQVAEIAIQTLEVIDGWLPPRALRLTLEWAGQHQDELSRNWDRARAHDRLAAIDPLP